ncbi:MAG: DUF6184 family natural product biosynthesis lipoprotein [Polyangiaceae bacterium]|jgi:hypothetical protein
MKTIKSLTSLTSVPAVVLALLLPCCASEPVGPQPIVPETQTPTVGVTATQALADEDVIERIASARCDRSQSCDRIGPGAPYRDRGVCMAKMRELVSKQLNTYRCPGGIGEVGVSRCLKSLDTGHCDMPGQEYPIASHCKIADMCIP